MPIDAERSSPTTAGPTTAAPTTAPTTAGPTRGVWFVLGVMAAVAALGFLLWRGPWRALQNAAPSATVAAAEVERLARGSSDLSLVWMSTRAWVEGENPYTVEGTGKVWADRSGSAFPPPSERSSALLVYPPSTFVVMAPWCVWEWPRSVLLWAAGSTVMLLGSVVLSLGLAGLTPRRAAWWWAAAGMLVMAPGGTAVSVGQLSILVFFLILLAQAARAAGRPALTGALLGVACAVKPQVALLFLAYEVGRKRWAAGAVGVLVAGALLAAGAWQLQRSGVDWLPQWRANLAAFAGSDNADPTAANPLRYHLINLHYLLHAVAAGLSVGAVKLAVYGVVGGLAAGYFVADFGKPQDRGEVLSLSFVSVLAMMVVYHRMYDAVVLLLPAAWVARELAAGRRGPGLVVAAAGLAAFLAPGASVLRSLVVSGRVAEGVARAWWFEGLIMPHAAAALLVLAVALLAARARRAGVPGAAGGSGGSGE